MRYAARVALRRVAAASAAVAAHRGACPTCEGGRVLLHRHGRAEWHVAAAVVNQGRGIGGYGG